MCGYVWGKKKKEKAEAKPFYSSLVVPSVSC